MKTLVLLSLFTTVSLANASNKYECSRYLNGGWKGFITIIANNKQEAEKLALQKYKEKIKVRVDYVKCK